MGAMGDYFKKRKEENGDEDLRGAAESVVNDRKSSGGAMSNYFKARKEEDQNLSANFSKWSSGVTDYFSGWDNDYKSRNSSYHLASDSDAYRQQNALERANYAKETEKYIDYVNRNRDAVQDPDETLKWLESVKSGLDSQGAALDQEYNFWNQFENEDQYNDWKRVDDWNNVDQKEDFERKSKYRPLNKVELGYGEGKGERYLNNLRDQVNYKEGRFADIPDDIRKKYNYIWNTEGWANANEYLDIAYPEKVDAGTAGVTGALNSSGFIPLLTLGAKISGNDQLARKLSRGVSEVQRQNPTAYKIGNIAGTVVLAALTSGAFSGIGAATGKAAGSLVGKIANDVAAKASARIIGGMATNAMSFMTVDAIQNSGKLATGQISAGDYFKSIGKAGLSSAAMGLVTGFSSIGIESFLVKHQLQTPFAEFIKNTTSATLGAGSRVGVNYALTDKNPTEAFIKGYRTNNPEATDDEINGAYQKMLQDNAARDLAVSFIFSVLSGYIHSAKATKEANSRIIGTYEKLVKRYSEFKDQLLHTQTKEEAIASLNLIENDALAVQKQLNSTYFAGQQNIVNYTNDGLNEIMRQCQEMAYALDGGIIISGESASASFGTMITDSFAEGAAQAAENSNVPEVDPDSVLRSAAEDRIASSIETGKETAVANAAGKTVGEINTKPEIDNGIDFTKTNDIGKSGNNVGQSEFKPMMQEDAQTSEAQTLKYKEEIKLSPIWTRIKGLGEEGLENALSISGVSERKVQAGRAFVESKFGDAAKLVYDTMLDPKYTSDPKSFKEDYVDPYPVEFYGEYLNGYRGNEENKTTIFKPLQKEVIRLAGKIDAKLNNGEAVEQDLELLESMLNGEVIERQEEKPSVQEESIAKADKRDYNTIVKSLPEDRQNELKEVVDFVSMGEEGNRVETFKNVLSNRMAKGEIPSSEIALEYMEYYDAARRNPDVDIDSIKPSVNVLTAQEKAAAVAAGRRDAEGDKYGTGKNDLRESGERDYVQNSGKQVSRMAEKAGSAQKAGSDRRRIADLEIKNLPGTGRQFSAVDIGLRGGTSKNVVREWDQPLTTAMRNAVNKNEKHGYKTVLFYGNNLSLENDGSARGVYDPANKTIYLRVDEENFTADKIGDHEFVHNVVGGKDLTENVNELWKLLENTIGQNNARALINAYEEAYDEDDEQLLKEEILCDLYAKMNVFLGAKSNSMRGIKLREYIPSVNEVIKDVQSIRNKIDQMAESGIENGNQQKRSRIPKYMIKAEEKREAGEKLTEKEFYSLYSAHKLDLRGEGNVEEQIQNIKEEGFKGYGGFGNNVMPTSQTINYPTVNKYNALKYAEELGGLPKGTAENYKKELGEEFGKPEPGNWSVRTYGPRKGEWIMLVPESGLEVNKWSQRVRPGYKPLFDYEFVQADYDFQPYYEMYSKAYDAANENKQRFSLEMVEPVKPKSKSWERGATTEEVMRLYPDLWNVAADESETRNPTQITSTVSTYRKIYDKLKDEGFDGTILDASSGLGYGTKAGIEEYEFDVDDIEPYPDENYKPKYTDYSKLNKKYDVIISNAVLNVTPQEQRDALVVKMGQMLKPGGKIYVNVRSLNEIKALQNKLDQKTGRLKNIKISDSEVAETSKGSYQKGFTKNELVSYLQDALGKGYDVKPASWFGNISAVVSKSLSEKEEDKEYFEAVNSGDMKTAQKMVDEKANEVFKNSKVKDKDGLLKMYHGTKEQFNEFLREKIGSTGRFEGSGFNFTPYEGRAVSYGKNVLAGYLDIEKPLSANSKTISVMQLAKIIREADPTGDNIIANYAQNTIDYGKESFVKRESMTAAKQIWDYADSDVDIYSDISSADPDAETLIDVFEKLGYDGLIHYDDNGKIKTAVAFDSNQFKKADPVTYDDNGNVIPLSERFNAKSNDIRFSKELQVKTGDEIETEYKKLSENEKTARYPVKFSLEMAERIEERAMMKAASQAKNGMLPYSMSYLEQRNREIQEAIDYVRDNLFNPETGNVYTDKNGHPLIPEAVRLDENRNFIGLNDKTAKGGLSNNIFDNGSYLKDAESTTECFRQLVYFAFAEKVSERLGRPLTEREAIIANQAAIEIGVDAPCIYCYSLLDRKAREAYKLQYIAERDAFMTQFEQDYKGDREAFKRDAKKNLEKYYQLYVNRVLDPSAYDEAGKKTKSRASQKTEERREANHEKGNLSEKEKRVRLWMDLYANGLKPISQNEVRKWESDAELRGNYASIKDGTVKKLRIAEIDDMMSWVQGSSQAKIRTPYTAYSNVSRNNKAISGILTWPQTTIDRLNSQFGLRFYSHADFHPAFTIDLMQQIRDASIRGLKGLMYCKPIEAAKICALTGMNTNISCFAKYDKKTGKYVCDPDMGADWDEVKKLRKNYKNVGPVMVVTSDDQLLWALTEDWIDVVIPLHKVRAGDVFMKEFGLNDYSRYQEDKLTDQEVYDRFVQDKIAASEKALSENQKKAIRKDSKSIFPTEHQNDYESYKKALAARGLTARFNDILMKAESGELSYNGIQITPQMYMKLVNETRQAEKDTEVLKPEFDIKEVKAAIDSLKKKGYYDYFKPNAMINGKLMNADDLADQVVNDIKAGKNANELGYGVKLNDTFLAGDPTAKRAKQLGLGGKHDQKLSREIISNSEDKSYSKVPLFDKKAKTLEEAEKIIEEYKRQMTVTTDPIDAKSADRAAKKLVQKYGNYLDEQKISDSFKEAGRIFYKDESIERDAKMRDALRPAAEDIVSHATQKTDENEANYQSLRQTLRGGIFISDQDKGNIADFNEWARRNIHYVIIKKDGKPIDSLYSELQDEFGKGMFPDEITDPSEKLVRAVDACRDLKSVYENPFQTLSMSEALSEVTDELTKMLYAGMIRKVDPTFADKYEARIEAEHQKTQKLVEEAVAENQKINDRVIAELNKEQKEYTKQMLRAQRNKDMSEKKAMSMNEQLRRLVKRLRNKKLSPVNRARVDEIIGDLDTKYINLTGTKLEELEQLNDYIKAHTEIIWPDRIKNNAESISKKHIGELDQEEVARLIEVLLSIETEVNNANKQIDTEDKRLTREQAIVSMNNIEKSAGMPTGDMGRAYSFFVLDTLSPRSFADRITGYQEDDPLKNAFDDLTSGETKMIDHMMRAYKIFDKWTENKDLMKKWQGKKADTITINGQGKNGSYIDVEITPAMRASLYMHSLNDDNMRHIQYGGVRIPRMDLYKKGDFESAYSKGTIIKLTKEDIRKIASHMTEAEREFCKAAQEYFQGMSQDEINDVSVKLLGYEIAGVEHYFPIYTDSNFVKTNFDGLKFDGTIEGMGSLQERITSYLPIYLQDITKVMKRSIDSSARYVGLAIPVRNVNKLMGVADGHFIEEGPIKTVETSDGREVEKGLFTVNAPDRTILSALDEKYGKPAIEYIRDLMRNLQTPGKEIKPIIEFWQNIRSNYAGAVLTLNMGVAIKQAASLAAAIATLGSHPILRSLWIDQLGKVDLEEIAKWTPVQWYRSRGFSTQEIGDLKAKGWNVPKQLNWIQAVDLWTTRKLWKASKIYVEEQMPQFKPGTDEYWEQVARIYNKTIWETQPNYTTMQRPANLRSDNFFIQTLMMFKTQPFQNFNIIYDAAGNYKARRNDYFAAKKNGDAEEIRNAEKKYKEAGIGLRRAIVSQFLSLIVFASMTALWAAFRGKTDNYKNGENENILTWVGGIGKDVLGGAAGMVPFGSDVWQLISSLLFKDKYYGYKSITDSAIYDALSSLYNFANSAGAGKLTINKIKGYAKDLSQALGIPLKNVSNLINGILHWFGVEEIF